MNALEQFERLITSVVEGTVARALGARLEPVEIARHIDRAMEDNRLVSPGLPIAPNHFVVWLHPDDLAGLGDLRPVVVQELTAYVANRAREQRWQLVGRPRVELVAGQEVPGAPDEAIPTPRPHEVVVTARVVPDASRSGPADPTRTQRFPTITPASNTSTSLEGSVEAPGRAGVAQRALVGVGKSRFRHTLDLPTTRIGRALDNDVVLEDSSVSRYHAEVYWRDGGYHVRDLDSTNGTRVNNRRVEESRLKPGDRLVLGAVELRFE